MPETAALITSPIGVLAVLCAVAGFFFYLEQATGAKLFQYVPPLLFIYITPVILSNVDIGGAAVIPNKSIVYSGLSTYALPAFIVLMLIKVDVPAVVKVMGKGVLVMLMGTAGVMIGGVVSYVAVHSWLPEDAWIPFLGLPKTEVYSTRSDFRPLDRDEQKRILMVGACLKCHTADSQIMQRSLISGLNTLLLERSEQCVLPVFE